MRCNKRQRRIRHVDNGIDWAVVAEEQAWSGSKLNGEYGSSILCHFGGALTGSAEPIGAGAKLTSDGELIVVPPHVSLECVFGMRLVIMVRTRAAGHWRAGKAFGKCWVGKG